MYYEINEQIARAAHDMNSMRDYTTNSATDEYRRAVDNATFDGGEIVRNIEADRLQIIFNGKPDEDMRAKLKSNGFRWSPRFGAWQRQLTDNAERAARQVLGL